MYFILFNLILFIKGKSNNERIICQILKIFQLFLKKHLELILHHKNEKNESIQEENYNKICTIITSEIREGCHFHSFALEVEIRYNLLV